MLEVIPLLVIGFPDEIAGNTINDNANTAIAAADAGFVRWSEPELWRAEIAPAVRSIGAEEVFIIKHRVAFEVAFLGLVHPPTRTGGKRILPVSR
jgi:hypothetical protein